MRIFKVILCLQMKYKICVTRNTKKATAQDPAPRQSPSRNVAAVLAKVTFSTIDIRQ